MLSSLLTTALLLLLLNVAAFVPAFYFQTERFYDLTGALSFLLGIAASIRLSEGQWSVHEISRCTVASLLTVLSTVRLGVFLVTRIMADGKDRRFDRIKPNFFSFLGAWVLQGFWALLTALPVYILNLQGCGGGRGSGGSGERDIFLDWLDVFLVFFWFLGFWLEMTADWEKRAWRERGGTGFIREGLWRWSRHPNYAGRILYSTSLCLYAARTLPFPLSLSCAGSFYETLLLLFVSGIPLLERHARKKWKEEYEEFAKTTALLIPYIY